MGVIGSGRCGAVGVKKSREYFKMSKDTCETTWSEAKQTDAQAGGALTGGRDGDDEASAFSSQKPNRTVIITNLLIQYLFRGGCSIRSIFVFSTDQLSFIFFIFAMRMRCSTNDHKVAVDYAYIQ